MRAHFLASATFPRSAPFSFHNSKLSPNPPPNHHSTIRHSHGGEQVEPQAHGPEQGRRAITSTPLESQLLSRLRQETGFFEALHESAIDDLMDVHLRDLGIGPRDILSRPCFLNRPLSTATHM